MNPFETEINDDLKNLMKKKLIFAERPNDTSAIRFASPEAYGLKVPCDFEVWNRKGQSIFLEVKSSKNPTSFAFEYIIGEKKKHQLEGGKYFVSLNKNYKFYYLINQRFKYRSGNCYALYVHNLDLLIQEYLKNGKKSIKWGELAERSRVIERVKQSWCLEELLNVR